jgi:AcrR family transcriptional regulator
VEQEEGYNVSMSQMIRRGISKAEWLEAGLQAMSKGSVTDITVEGLARSLGIAKAGFYWHFKNRDDLLHQLLDYWVHELTEVAAENLQLLALEPKKRLITLAEMILEYDLNRYEFAFRQCALWDATASRVVRKVNRMRLDFVRKAFSELGFTGDDLDMRAMLYTCYHTWESPMFGDISRKRRRELIAKRIELLTSQQATHDGISKGTPR